MLPKYYINRNIVQYVIDDYGSHNIHIVYGKRVSGKTYVLAGVLQKTINRDVYYFPSNDCINKTVINNLIAKRNIVVLIDTNAISRADLEYILSLDKKLLISNSINFVVCVNTSKKEDISEVARFKDKSHINLFYLDNYLSNNEFLDLKQQYNIKFQKSIGFTISFYTFCLNNKENASGNKTWVRRLRHTLNKFKLMNH